MKRWLLLLIFPLIVSGGQSIHSHPSLSRGITATKVPSDANLRLEFQIHGWMTPSQTQNIVWLSFFDFQITAYSNSTMLIVHRKGGSCSLDMTARQHALVRVQVSIADKRLDCEIWNVNGQDYDVRSAMIESFSASSEANGSFPAFATGSWRIGFMRGFTTLLPLRSRPPVTADVGNFFDWKFDGNGADASGHGRTASTNGASFSPTPMQGVFSLPGRPDTPSWAPFRPLRAGFPNTLVSKSYSLADVSSGVTCVWQQISGPSKLNWIGRFTCNPTVSGAVFGSYIFRLRATDAAGNDNSSDIEIGAVAYDDNGVVIYPDPRLKRILGEQKVMTLNSWERADERQVVMTRTNFNTYSLNGGSLDTDIVYPTVNGVSRSGKVLVSTATTTVTGTGTSFLSVFCGGRAGPAIPGAFIAPSFPLTGLYWRNRWREIPVASCVSDTELIRGGYDHGSITQPVEWRTSGLYRHTQEGVTGTVYINVASPRALLGVGTNFLALCGGSPGSPTIADAVNVFADGYTLTRGISACVSNTELTLTADWPETSIGSPGVPWGYRKAGDAGEWRAYNSTGNNVNFYGVDLAHYSLYYRSGWSKARDAARWMAERWWQNPSQLLAGRNLQMAGGILLHAIDTEYTSNNVDRTKFWEVLYRQVESRVGTDATDLYDHRESTYPHYYAALAAQFDPNETRRADLRSKLATSYKNIYGPRQLPNGNYRATIFSSPTRHSERWFAVTNGSATVTKQGGTDIPADFCGDPATFYTAGTLTITKGSTAAVGTGTDWTGFASRVILIRGTLDGQPYSQLNRFTATATTATSGTLRYPWPGDTITNYRIQAAMTVSLSDYAAMGTISVNASNAVTDGTVQNVLDGWHWCTVDSATQLTLDRPFTGTTGYRRLTRGIPGSSNTFFMSGIVAMAMFEAAKALETTHETESNGYYASALALMSYIESGMAPYGGGALPYYDSQMDICKPISSIPNGCDQGSSTGVLRDYATELVRAFTMAYEHHPTTHNRDRVNVLMSSLYGGSAAWAKPIPQLSDGLEVSMFVNYNFNAASRWKNTGQAYGQGCANCWEGAREGGVAPEVQRPVLIPFVLDEIPQATLFRVITFYPSGRTASVQCTASPCEILVDARQGDHWILKQYLSANGELVAEAARELLQVQ
ncbi:MAG: hypothetical protein KIT83_05745 [Bryobacterales bacterium]|nr:hypothetical protein [Bryobacterales bacterium]